MVTIFLNNRHELRSGWKFATYVAIFFLVVIATRIALSLLIDESSVDLTDQLVMIALSDVALFVPAVAAMWLTIRFTDHRPLRTFGIGFLPSWRRDLSSGALIAAGMLAVIVAGCYTFGYVSMRWTATQVSPRTLMATFSVLIVAALNEELVFRGFPLQILMEGMGEWPGIIALSALFGAMHMGNPNVSVVGIVNVIVAGVLLSLAYARTRSLWLPYSIHVVWNLGLGFVFGFPLSGIDIASLWTTGTAGSETILGGSFGPEGGLLATFVFATAAVVVNKRRIKES
jgi:membrane protease YdiL (CAAX protease family)